MIEGADRERVRRLFLGTGALLVGAGTSILVITLSCVDRPLAGCAALLLLVPAPAALPLPALLLGSGLGPLAALGLLAHQGLVPTLVIGGVLAVAGLAARQRRTNWIPARAADPGAMAVLSFCAGAALLLRGHTQGMLQVSGADLGALAGSVAPLLLLVAAGAAVGRRVGRLHPRLDPLGATWIWFALLLAAMFESTTATALVARAGQLHAPDSSRVEFLCSVALLATSSAGLTAILLGLVGERLLGNRGPGLRGVALIGGVALACFDLFEQAYVLGIGAVALSGLLAGSADRSPKAARGGPARPFVALAGLLLAGWMWGSDRPGRPDLPMDDPIRFASGAPANPDEQFLDRRVLRGRPVERPAPPGWPLPAGSLVETLLAIDRLAAPGPIELLGEEAIDLLSREGIPRPVMTGERRTGAAPAALVLLPSLFAQPLTGLAGALRLAERSTGTDQEGGAWLRIACIDLAEVRLAEIATLTRHWRERIGETTLLLHGTLCILLASERPPDPATLLSAARPPGPVLALPAAACGLLADDLGGGRMEQLLLRPARHRPASRRLDLAASNLRRLLARSTGPELSPAANRSGAAPETRLRLTLAVAILEDDAHAEDRLLDQLEGVDPAAASDLRAARGGARRRLRAELLLELDRDPFQADLRHRQARLFDGQGRTAAALHELKRTLELRPGLRAAAIDLAEVFPQTGPQGPWWSRTGGVPRQPERFEASLRRMAGQPEEIAERARLERALSRAWVIAAAAESIGTEERQQRLQRGLAGYGIALALDRFDPEAHAGLARIHLQLGHPDRAAGHARAAVRMDPLLGVAWEILARTSEDAREARTARKRWLESAGSMPAVHLP